MRDYLNLALIFSALIVVAVLMPGCANNSSTSLDAKALFDRHERYSGGSSE